VELVNQAGVERILDLLALLLPIAGLLAGVLAARRRAGPASRSIVRGLAIGLLGPLIWVLWHVTSTIQSRLGLDSVAALFIDFGMFIAAGFGVGYMIGRRNRDGKPR
jgi:4-amino-4-deoxy-L-arabinose transferase-like glycosyltransferase